MRIRSIKPEFWRSEDISALGLADRLLFIGLWSYVDDNGVGKDRLSQIAADLFADDLERESSETFARVSRGVQNLFEAGLIVRYEVDSTAYLRITNWSDHQRIDKPGKARYPLDDAEDAKIRESVANPRETLAPGTGEQRNRGIKILSDARASDDGDFLAFYSRYPRKEAREAARKAFKGALKKTTAEQIMAGLEKYLVAVQGKDRQFIALPASWLNAGRWADEYDTPAPVSSIWRQVPRDA